MSEKPSPSAGFEDDVSLSPDSNQINSQIGNNEEDKYEDSLDFDISKGSTNMWLLKMPVFLIERWKAACTLEGQNRDLGIVRIANNQTSTDRLKVKLILNDSPVNDEIPHEYDISMAKRQVVNTFVFSEKNLFNDNNNNNNNNKDDNKSDTNDKNDKNDKNIKNNKNDKPNNNKANNKRNASFQKFTPRKRFVPYRAIIPKKTALVGTVIHEGNVTPVITDKNYNRVVSMRRALQSVNAPRPKVTLLNEIPGVTSGSVQPSLKGNQSLFLRHQEKKKEQKITEGKAIRIPKNELLDLLFKLFEEYSYWTIRGLRERTRQPEAYLKEVLESIAVLNKRGPYSLKYSLKPEYKRMADQKIRLAEEEAAGTATTEVKEEEN